MKKVVANKKNRVYIPLCHDYGCVAQLVEQLTLNQWVWGSNPHAPTITKSPRFMRGLFVMVRSVR